MEPWKFDRLDLVDLVNRNTTRLCQIASLHIPPVEAKAEATVTSATQAEIVAIIDVLLMLGELALDMNEYGLDLGNLQERIGKAMVLTLEIGN